MLISSQKGPAARGGRAAAGGGVFFIFVAALLYVVISVLVMVSTSWLACLSGRIIFVYWGCGGVLKSVV